MRMEEPTDKTGRMDRSTLVHRALAEPTRATLYELLRSTTCPLDATELADGLGVHPNTVRSHLQVLEEAGLVVSVIEKRMRPGRPRRLFDASRDATEEEHQTLAAALASVLEPLEGGRTLAHEAGRQAGRKLVEDGGRDGLAPMQRVVALLDARGFAAQAEENAITMRRCPYGEVAGDHPAIVCGFHAGLIDGALERAGATVRLGRLDAWAREGACIAHLAELEPDTRPEG
jgi:predicted ArsR family transcriptional regulator